MNLLHIQWKLISHVCSSTFLSGSEDCSPITKHLQYANTHYVSGMELKPPPLQCGCQMFALDSSLSQSVGTWPLLYHVQQQLVYQNDLPITYQHTFKCVNFITAITNVRQISLLQTWQLQSYNTQPFWQHFCMNMIDRLSNSQTQNRHRNRTFGKSWNREGTIYFLHRLWCA
jgi:hypothetical protein